MGIFTDGDDEEEELFNLYMLSEIHENSSKGGSTNHAGGVHLSMM